jgi:hypothetical protein
VLIDYQPELFESIRSETDAGLVELHAFCRPCAIALTCELFRDWASPLGEPGRDLVNWYVDEVEKWPATVGFAQREKLRARAALVG